MDIRISKVPQVDWSATVDVSGVYLKITTNYFVIFLAWSWRLSGIYLKITTNIYVFFSGSLEDLLLDPLVFCSNPLSRLGLHFCSDFFFGLGMENVVGGVGKSYFTATKSWPNSPPPNTNPDDIGRIVQAVASLKSRTCCNAGAASHSQVVFIALIAFQIFRFFLNSTWADSFPMISCHLSMQQKVQR